MNTKIRVLFLSQVPLIKYGLKCGFDQLGHITSFLDNECSTIFKKSKDEQVKLIMDRVSEFKPDLVFTEGYIGLPLAIVYSKLQKKGIPLFCWDIEASNFPALGELFALHSDFLWTTMEEKLDNFRVRGIKCDTLLFGCNPEFHKPSLSEDRFKHDISIVARNYSNRYDETKWLVLDSIEKGYDVKVYGIWWMHGTRAVNLLQYPNNYWSEYGNDADLPYEWLSPVVNSSKIMLGMNVPIDSNSHCSMRPFETLACSNNSLLVGHYQKGQKNIFGDYMYHVNNANEAEYAFKEILSMTDEQRIEKAKLAREFVHKNHNYSLRAQQVVDKFYEFGGI